MLKFTFTRAQLEEKRALALSKYQLTISGDQGTATYEKVKVAFRYIESRQLLVVAIVTKPFSIPTETILATINAAMAS